MFDDRQSGSLGEVLCFTAVGEGSELEERCCEASSARMEMRSVRLADYRAESGRDWERHVYGVCQYFLRRLTRFVVFASSRSQGRQDETPRFAVSRGIVHHLRLSPKAPLDVSSGDLTC